MGRQPPPNPVGALKGKGLAERYLHVSGLAKLLVIEIILRNLTDKVPVRPPSSLASSLSSERGPGRGGERPVLEHTRSDARPHSTARGLGEAGPRGQRALMSLTEQMYDSRTEDLEDVRVSE